MTGIEVRAEEGGVSVTVAGRGRAPAFGRSVLDAAGALLTWPDITGRGSDGTGAVRPGTSGGAVLPDAFVDSVSDAQTWLWAVYGAGVARAVDACATGRARTLRTSADPGALAHDLHRLATGHWAARWWPASHLDGVPALDADLLGLELAALTHRCQQVWDADRDPAAELVLEHRAGIAPLIGWWRADPYAVADVLAAVRAVADDAGLDGDDLDELAAPAAPDGVRAPADPYAPPPGTAARAGVIAPHWPRALPDSHALAAGGVAGLPPGARLIARGTGTNDWCRHPPGFVDASEEAVTWTAFAHGSRRAVRVSAVAGTARPAPGVRPVAEVGADGAAPARARCERTADTWTGVVDTALPDTAAPALDVQVVLPGFDPGPQHPDAARRTREGLRALARRRLAAAAPPGSGHGSNGAVRSEGPGAPDGAGPDPAPFLAEVVAAHIEEDF